MWDCVWACVTTSTLHNLYSKALAWRDPQRQSSKWAHFVTIQLSPPLSFFISLSLGMSQLCPRLATLHQVPGQIIFNNYCIIQPFSHIACFTLLGPNESPSTVCLVFLLHSTIRGHCLQMYNVLPSDPSKKQRETLQSKNTTQKTRVLLQWQTLESKDRVIKQFYIPKGTSGHYH